MNQIKWTPDMDLILGTMTDNMASLALNVSIRSVSRRRQKQGIRSYNTPSPTITWTLDMDLMLGRMTDRDVANSLFISRGAVDRRRKKLGIKPFYTTRKKQKTTKNGLTK